MNADYARRLESVIRLGIVSAVSYDPPRCRIASGGITTDWLPWLCLRAGATRYWSPPTIGERGVVISPSGDPGVGMVLIGLYCDDYPAPSASPSEHVIDYPDGARIAYDHASGALSVTGIQTALIEATGSITLRASEIMLDAPQTTSTGAHTIRGLFTYLAGLLGFGGDGGAGSTVTGTLRQSGGELSSNGVVLDSHIHRDSVGGTTGGPL
ncbi:phage baseplate assembly protein V [Chitiniphilus eburneus]|uniref:phage baseplate assembly protein V n=1 Tax=Chitiniphilus eburneus TaxID=2571148 RepID=UPI0035D0D57F